jgi:hypothetical protein
MDEELSESVLTAESVTREVQIEAIVESKRRKTKQAPKQEAMPIELLPSQIDHFERLKTMLSQRKFALDFSVMGAGKT